MSDIVLNTVYDHRTKAGITQEELGHMVGVTRQTIIAIEKGNYTPSVLLALKIAQVFHTPVHNIFSLQTHEK